MIYLKRLGAVATLALVLGTTVWAGATNTPACQPVPGEVPTMPCPTQAGFDASIPPGEISTPPASESFDFLSLAETALALVF
jgi:hypothetical protein